MAEKQKTNKITDELDDTELDLVTGGVGADGQDGKDIKIEKKQVKGGMNQKTLEDLEPNCRAPLILKKN